MRIVIEICLGLLYVSCLAVCCLYFRNNNPLKQYEEQAVEQPKNRKINSIR